MARHQQGHIYEASGSFYVRYRATQIVDGKAIREQCSQWLCEKDGKRYKNVKDKNVKIKCKIVAVGTTIADRPRTDPYVRVYAYGSSEG